MPDMTHTDLVLKAMKKVNAANLSLQRCRSYFTDKRFEHDAVLSILNGKSLRLQEAARELASACVVEDDPT